LKAVGFQWNIFSTLNYWNKNLTGMLLLFTVAPRCCGMCSCTTLQVSFGFGTAELYRVVLRQIKLKRGKRFKCNFKPKLTVAGH